MCYLYVTALFTVIITSLLNHVMLFTLCGGVHVCSLVTVKQIIHEELMLV